MDETELKYKARDIMELIEVFADIDNSIDTEAAVIRNLATLSKYPEEDLAKFAGIITDLENAGIVATENNYMGIIGLITIRMSL